MPSYYRQIVQVGQKLEVWEEGGVVLASPPAPLQLLSILLWLSSRCFYDCQGFISAEKVQRHLCLSDILGRNLGFSWEERIPQNWGLFSGKARDGLKS